MIDVLFTINEVDDKSLTCEWALWDRHKFTTWAPVIITRVIYVANAKFECNLLKYIVVNNEIRQYFYNTSFTVCFRDVRVTVQDIGKAFGSITWGPTGNCTKQKCKTLLPLLRSKPPRLKIACKLHFHPWKSLLGIIGLFRGIFPTMKTDLA